MKEFLEPELNVLAFTIEDIVTTSGGPVEDGEGGVVLPPDKLN